ncbi:MAG: site-specific integrase [Actinobacteria bacterium]|nr:site-specific integrase [Actinomycetota bacterium]MCA1700649.1 site-specific integrase [Actinomycetota bacterium]
MASRLWVPVASGPLARYAVGYGSWLGARGYSRWTVGHRLWQLDLLSRWLEREGLSPGELTPERLEAFVAARRAAGYSTWLSVRSTALPLAYLRELGVVPAAPAAAVVEDPLERLLAGYSQYLFDERALTEHTVLVRYVPAARLFLDGVVRADGRGLECLTAAEVSSFLARECRRRSIAGGRELVVALRSFLRYLHVEGLISAPLEWAVPGVADLRDRSLARGLDPAAVKRLLASCDRRRTAGRRDYAILLLLARLGLRAGEVAALALDDLDWRSGELLVAGKGGRYDCLPLPVDLGEAIVSYLRRRPRIEERALFLRVLAPAGALRTSAVSGVVRSACKRAGLPSAGSHALRHTVATEMLKQGASLPEIGEVLRHREQKTTAIYAKVDRKTLRGLARPWPEGGAA